MKPVSIEVKEYQKLTFNQELEKNTDYKFIDKTLFTNLRDFIEEVNNSQKDDDSFDFFRVNKEKYGEYIQPKNYIGVVEFKNGDQIQILPKIDISNPDDTKTIKDIVVRMIKSLDDFKYKVKGSTKLGTQRMNLYEVFINMYLQSVSDLIKKGLKSSYITVENNLNTLKGKLYFQKQITLNFAHKEKFYCVYDEYELNRPENKLIKTTLLKLSSITKSLENKNLINKSLIFFDEIDESSNYDYDFSKVVIDRSMTEYKQILEWSKVFLYDKSFTMFSGKSVARSLLFPMEQLFEAYVGKQIKKRFDSFERTVSLQDKGHYLFENIQKFKLRPDIVIFKGDEPKIILDTKWKQITDNPREYYGISQLDMYQMYAYAKKYHVHNVVLLYPHNEVSRRIQNQIEFKDSEVCVKVFFVDLADMDTTLDDLLDLINNI